MGRPAQAIRDRWLRRTAVALAVLTVVLDGSALSLLARVPAGASVVLGLREAAPYALAWVSFAVVGALIVSRHPRHRIGWLCLAIAVAISLLAQAGAYATYALAIDPNNPLGLAAAWTQTTFGLPALSIATFIVLLFPDGHLPSPRWRVVAVAALVGVALSTPALAVAPLDLGGYAGVPNPIALGGFPGAVATVVGLMGGLLIAIGLLGAMVSLVVRWRVSRGDERRQLTWIAFAGTGLALVLALSPVLSPDIIRAQPSSSQHLLTGIALAGIAWAIGIAVLRYRLYDIDLVIDRTLVYGALTAILAGLYAASIRLFQALFVTVTGEGSDAALVLTTLVLATSFTPIKRRLETIVERRYRRATSLAAAEPAEGRSAEAGLGTRLDAIDRSLARLNERLVAVEGRDGETRSSRSTVSRNRPTPRP